MAASEAPALRLAGICKRFDGVAALDGAALTVSRGEVHALLGENGAGKSTLVNVLCGLYSADSGSIEVHGARAHIHGTRDAIALGIGMVHQHFKLVGPFSVAENILLACGARLGVRNAREAGRLAAKAAARLGFEFDAGARTDTLSIAERQRIEIVKLVLLGADIVLLDEPTAVLTDTEAAAVLTLMRQMAAQGKAVVLITHRLGEVTRHADRVTIMRGGRTVVSGAAANGMSETDLATHMVGTAVKEFPGDESQLLPGATAPLAPGKADSRTRLELSALSVKRDDGTLAVDRASLAVRAGQVLGVAGVGGNGQTELAEALFGLRPVRSGSVRVDGETVEHAGIRSRRRRGLRLVPADRFDFALFADLRAYENLALPAVPDGRFGPFAWLRRRVMRSYARGAFESREIVGGTPVTRTRLLSGGNAQKLLLARELNEEAAVLVAHSPTRGLDVRACAAVHASLVERVHAGTACLLISEDLDEVLQLSTHVAVMSRGQIHGPFERKQITRARIGELMAGHA